MQGGTKLKELLMITGESMWSKRPVSRITVPLFFLLTLFSSHIYCTLFCNYSSFCFQVIQICAFFGLKVFIQKFQTLNAEAGLTPGYVSRLAIMTSGFFH